MDEPIITKSFLLFVRKQHLTLCSLLLFGGVISHLIGYVYYGVEDLITWSVMLIPVFSIVNEVCMSGVRICGADNDAVGLIFAVLNKALNSYGRKLIVVIRGSHHSDSKCVSYV